MNFGKIMWGAAAVYLVTGLFCMRRKTPMRLSFISKTPAEKISDIPAYNKEIGKMWCAMAVFLLAGGGAMMANPAFSVLFFVVASTVGVGGVAWWQSRIEKKYLEE